MVRCQRDVLSFPEAALDEAPLHFPQLYVAQGIRGGLKYVFPLENFCIARLGMS